MKAHIDDNEPRNAHPLSCALWTSSDPAVDCDCRGETFQAGVDRLVQRFESYAPQQREAS